MIYKVNVPRALKLIQEALKDEHSDTLFYEWLIERAPYDDIDIITGIRDDEKKHARMFKQIYFTLTGKRTQGNKLDTFHPPKTYLDGLARAIMDESGATELYRQIYFALPGDVYKNMLFEIMSDEVKHGARYNYLYAKNK